MDGQSFDGLVRTLVTATSRRVAVLGVAGATLTALISLAGWETADAKRRRKRRKRKKRKRGGNDGGGDQCDQATCNDQCVDLQSDPNNCGSCGNACATGLTCCDGLCRALDSDNSNCGACGNGCFISGSRFCVCGMCVFCPLGASLNPDTCTCDCPSGQTDCDGVCRDTC